MEGGFLRVGASLGGESLIQECPDVSLYNVKGVFVVLKILS